MQAADAITIAKHKAPEDAASFDGLRKDGLVRVQQLAGNRWTDYNEHDPGVTILEALCYALTESLYKIGFPVADLLADAQGIIDWQRQALLPAEEAFPARPASELDYRAAMLDQIPEAENLRLEPILDNAQKPTGLYRLLLRLRTQSLQPGAEMLALNRTSDETANLDRVLQKVYEIFSRMRNLCEDINVDATQVQHTAKFELLADVEIFPGLDPAEILARIYQTCGDYLSAGIDYESYDSALRKGKQPEEIFRGPLTSAGMVANSVRESKTTFSAPEIYAQIKSVDGVLSVTVPPEASTKTAGIPLQLWRPEKDEEIKVHITRSGVRLHISAHELNMRLEELSVSHRGMRLDASTPHLYVPRPDGTPRNLSVHRSVQYEFPSIYGIGAQRVPDSAKLNRKVSARQLRGYLVFFDQLLANQSATLASLRDLYSLDVKDSKTYAYQKLTEESFPGIAETQQSGAEQTLATTCQRQDRGQRAQRLLNYLLALYGEEFSSAATGLSATDDLAARVHYLQDSARITRDRGAARDYARYPDRSDNRSGLEIKLDHLLGFHATFPGRDGVRVMEHVLLSRSFDPFVISVLFPAWKDSWKTANFKKLAAEAVSANCPAHISAEMYWLSLAEMQEFDRLHLQWWVGRLSVRQTGKEKLEEHAKLLRDFLDRLRKEQE